MKKITISLKSETDNSYNIFIQSDQQEKITKWLQKNKIGNKYAIITDDKVYKLYAQKFTKLLQKNNITHKIYHFPNGEKSKELQSIENLSQQLIKDGFDRKDAIIAMGGGVVGDMGGFLASIYMRGIPFIQIPTTLLAMVDASVGGKTGVNLEIGKNLLGTFYQPKAVFIDTEYLKTLSIKQIKNGLAEIIKYGIIWDEKLFQFVEKNLDKILKLEQQSLNRVIEQSIEIKAEIVEKDEKENDLRMILNYGHTYGHAIEKMSQYKLLHGYAISIGMILENNLAVEANLLKLEAAERIKKLIKAAGLPTTTMKKPNLKDLNSDKKKSGKDIKLALPTKIGKCIIHSIECQ